MNTRFLILILTLLSACVEKQPSIDGSRLNRAEYDALMMRLLPYVVKKPDHIKYDERFDPGLTEYYRNLASASNARLRFYYANDTANFFFFEHRDLSSLYEHYRGLGGYFREDDKGSITLLNLLYHTPRFTSAEMAAKGELLFKEMIARGNVDAFLGRRDLIHAPNKDFYYDTHRNRWDYTQNSSWRFLREEN
ncbi:MAG TPA: hypothetical protein VKZ68_05630 [Ohtaekwangia sp.]|nr:hypothetical protein [Ohtaekwangia sp.]